MLIAVIEYLVRYSMYDVLSVLTSPYKTLLNAAEIAAAIKNYLKLKDSQSYFERTSICKIFNIVFAYSVCV